jgi:hypothetical protein
MTSKNILIAIKSKHAPVVVYSWNDFGTYKIQFIYK